MRIGPFGHLSCSVCTIGFGDRQVPAMLVASSTDAVVYLDGEVRADNTRSPLGNRQVIKCFKCGYRLTVKKAKAEMRRQELQLGLSGLGPLPPPESFVAFVEELKKKAGKQ